MSSAEGRLNGYKSAFLSRNVGVGSAIKSLLGGLFRLLFAIIKMGSTATNRTVDYECWKCRRVSTFRSTVVSPKCCGRNMNRIH